MNNDMKLADYVVEHANRGDCMCGKCIDVPANPQQPSGHTVDLTFFKVAQSGGNKEKFLSLVKAEYPGWLDGEEHNYMQVGGEVGDQGLALMVIGLGHLLGVWKAMTPDTMMPFLPDEMKMKMAGAGMVSLKYEHVG